MYSKTKDELVRTYEGKPPRIDIALGFRLIHVVTCVKMLKTKPAFLCELLLIKGETHIA